MDVKDYGDVMYSIPEDAKNHSVPNMTHYPHTPYCNYEVSKNVQQIIKDGRTCVTLGGDHSIGK